MVQQSANPSVSGNVRAGRTSPTPNKNNRLHIVGCAVNTLLSNQKTYMQILFVLQTQGRILWPQETQNCNGKKECLKFMKQT